ncbi:hypothetical protein Ddye_026818 [Dipteronia dyeriana]|uniref:Legume lectin domain-containing protein n=1 Tax=Dipteronia dyeriana TaxID=168575 RepID=A0AAD9TNQ0_9ROSI|nr:hypothetical protein Ddye_026818 [Dipteronia dyeriana]
MKMQLFKPYAPSSQSTSAFEFAFKGFNASGILLYGSATLDSSAISLTQNTTFSIGRAVYHSKILTSLHNSSTVLPFRTSFTFSITPYKNQPPGHGLVFVFVPSSGTAGASSAQHLGFLNRTNDGNPDNHVFGIEFDVFQNQEFSDINGNHVGVNVNSLTSVVSHKAGYWLQGDAKNSHNNKTNWSFHELKLNNGAIYQANSNNGSCKHEKAAEAVDQCFPRSVQNFS